MESFKASVQYGDWNGTAAADDADQNAIRAYLKQKGLIHDGEFLLAVSLWIGENRQKSMGIISIHASILEEAMTINPPEIFWKRLMTPTVFPSGKSEWR